MSAAMKVSSRVSRMKRGVPFSINGFYSLGSHASVQKALSRLAKDGVVERVSKGFYSRPKSLPSMPSIKISASAEQVAKAWAREHGYKLASQGQEAAYRLGLQTQAPVKTIFWTNGPSRQFKIGHEVVEVRHTTGQKLRWSKALEGTLLRGLSVISPDQVEVSGLKLAFKRLSLSPAETKEALSKLSAVPLLQAWEGKFQQLEQII